MPTDEEERLLEALIAAGFPPPLAAKALRAVGANLPVEEQRALIAHVKADPMGVKNMLMNAMGGGYYTYPARIVKRNADGTFDVEANAKADPNGELLQTNHRAIAEALGIVDGMQFGSVRHDPKWGRISSDDTAAEICFEEMSLEKPVLWKASIAVPLYPTPSIKAPKGRPPR